MACAGSVCCHRYVQGEREEALVSGAKREEMLYEVAFKSAKLLKMSLVTAAAMLAICLLALAETTNTAEAKDSLPENGKIAFTSYRRGMPNIYVMNADGTRLKGITHLEAAALEPTWSPDGKKIAFNTQSRNTGMMNLSVVKADGTNLRVLQSHSSRTYNYPTWAPDGTKLAFSGNPPLTGVHDVFTMDPDGSNLINLTRTPRDDEHYPAFSPDGSQLCFFRGNSYKPKQATGIYIMDADGSDPTLLADEHLAGQCDWSPDGTKIAFTNTQGGTEEIYVMNADGSGVTNLTRTNTEWERDPNWSPDGTRIAFERGSEEDIDIYTTNLHGSDVAQLTHSHGPDIDPDWQPLPSKKTVRPPDTGGPSLLLVAGALLFSGGVLLYAAVKRRM